MALEPGRQVSHYRLIEKIGEGGMGVVWKAEDTRLHRHVALKFVSGDGEAEPTVDRHLREARAASALNHPHICSIHDIGESDGRRYIVMELLEGRSLAERLRSGPLDVETAVALATQVADALGAAHEKNIVHRDIKPANVVVTADNRAKVLDFGLAKFSGAQEDVGPDDATRTSLDLTTPGSVMGTAKYMPPEQARGGPLDARADVFSLGAVLYEMVSGRRAFAGKTAAEVFDSILNKDPERLGSDVPDALSRIVDRALQKDPALRYRNAAEMAADLRALQRDASPPRGGALKGKHVAAVAATVLLLAVAAVWFVSRRDAGEPSSGAGEPASALSGLKVAVLPFQGDPDQRYFSDGLTGEIVTELSRYHELAVMPCRSGPCEGPGTDARRIGEELGVLYVLKGTLQSSPDRIRVNVQLYDGGDGRFVWGETFQSERTARDLFALQDELTQKVVSAIAGAHGALARAELPRTRRKPPESLASHDCVLQAYNYLQNAHDDENHLAARSCLEQVVEREPDYVEGLAWLAYLYAEQFHHRRNQPPHGEYDSLERAVEVGERAVALDDSNQLAHGYLGLAVGFAGDDERALAEMRRAVELNPKGNPTVLVLLAWYLAFQGDFETSVPIVRRILELIPSSPPEHIDGPLWVEAYVNSRYDEALVHIRNRVSGPGPGQFIQPLFLAATLGQLGRVDEAQPALRELRALWDELCRQTGCEGLRSEDVRRELVERWAVADPIADKVVDGLEKTIAGRGQS